MKTQFFAQLWRKLTRRAAPAPAPEPVVRHVAVEKAKLNNLGGALKNLNDEFVTLNSKLVELRDALKHLRDALQTLEAAKARRQSNDRLLLTTSRADNTLN